MTAVEKIHGKHAKEYEKVLKVRRCPGMLLSGHTHCTHD